MLQVDVERQRRRESELQNTYAKLMRFKEEQGQQFQQNYPFSVTAQFNTIINSATPPKDASLDNGNATAPPRLER